MDKQRFLIAVSVLSIIVLGSYFLFRLADRSQMVSQFPLDKTSFIFGSPWVRLYWLALGIVQKDEILNVPTAAVHLQVIVRSDHAVLSTAQKK